MKNDDAHAIAPSPGLTARLERRLGGQDVRIEVRDLPLDSSVRVRVSKIDDPGEGFEVSFAHDAARKCARTTEQPQKEPTEEAHPTEDTETPADGDASVPRPQEDDGALAVERYFKGCAQWTKGWKAHFEHEVRGAEGLGAPDLVRSGDASRWGCLWIGPGTKVRLLSRKNPVKTPLPAGCRLEKGVVTMTGDASARLLRLLLASATFHPDADTAARCLELVNACGRISWPNEWDKAYRLVRWEDEGFLHGPFRAKLLNIDRAGETGLEFELKSVGTNGSARTIRFAHFLTRRPAEGGSFSVLTLVEGESPMLVAPPIEKMAKLCLRVAREAILDPKARIELLCFPFLNEAAIKDRRRYGEYVFAPPSDV